jgi:hypothetical protein
MINTSRILVGKPERKISLGSQRNMQKKNVKMKLKEIGNERVVLTYLYHISGGVGGVRGYITK